jgi:tetratricopeptide (TPR) repeat protein
MNILSNKIQVRCAQVQAALRGTRPEDQPAPALIILVIELAREALQGGRPDLAVETLEMLVERAPRQVDALLLLGFAYGREQRIPEAAHVLAQAANLEPEEPITVLAHAQATLDAGLPAIQLFDRAHRLMPGDLKAVNGWAASLALQGEAGAAEALLAETLLRHPDWLAGHKNLAALRFTNGDTLDFARSYAAACAVQPQNLPLRLAWFGTAAQTRDWEKALQILADGENLIGAVPAFAAARALIFAESGDADRAEALFAQTEGQHDDVLRIAHMRHCLRTAQIEKAERLALSLMQGASAPSIWPYLSLIWRLREDARAQWLDGTPPYIRAFDLDFSAGELEGLAAVLRRLHTARGPFVEQSVRGGTQTDTERQLFFRAEPEIQRVRAKVSEAIREYVAGLPTPVPGHPLLGVPRGRILFSGSWSVRLTAHGFHVSHTHPMGWISSALYISLPLQLGAEPAGWISFGAPPADLGLDLPPYARFEPKPGRLILFPSTMWHETLPFDDGERLVIAFDVMRPQTASRVDLSDGVHGKR